MRVDGEEAAKYQAVRLDSFRSPYGKDCTLVTADESTGEVIWKDSTGEGKSVTLGQHAIRIIARHSRS